MTRRRDSVRERRDAFEAFRLRLVDGYAERLVTGMSTARPEQTRSLALTRAIGTLVVLPVHLVSLVSLAGGAYLLVLGHTWPERLLGVVLLLVCYGVHPTLPKRPPHVARLLPDKAPATFAVVRQVGELVGADIPDEILVSTEFNASVGRVGLRRKVLVVGAQLWVAAAPQARVALLAHELGHIAHHDLTSGLWVGTARNSLRKWDQIVQTPRIGTRRGMNGSGTAILLAQTFLFPILRAIVGSYSALVEWANAPAHRRQEMLADLDAARTAGTDGALDLFDTLLARLNVDTAVASAAVDGRRPDIWTVVGERLAARGPEERTRARAAATTERTRIDASHPATTLRIRLLESRAWAAAALVPDAGTWAAVDAELAQPLAIAAKALGERIRYRR